jgi:hypothetical protein
LAGGGADGVPALPSQKITFAFLAVVHWVSFWDVVSLALREMVYTLARIAPAEAHHRATFYKVKKKEKHKKS